MRSPFPVALVVLTIVVGCTSMPRQTYRANGEPLFVSQRNHEAVWEKVVDVVHDYKFAIARESRLDGVIETEYKVGSGLLEPWHPESVGFYERLESSIQPIRRRVFIHVTPTESGYLIAVEAFKEIEHVDGGPAVDIRGGATFQENRPFQRQLDLIGERSRPVGWVPMGRDLKLERAMLHDLREVFTES